MRKKGRKNMKLDHIQKQDLDKTLQEIIEHKGIKEYFSHIVIDGLVSKSLFTTKGMAIFSRIDLEPDKGTNNNQRTINMAIGYNKTPILTDSLYSIPITEYLPETTLWTERGIKQSLQGVFDSREIRSHLNNYNIIFQHAFVILPKTIFQDNKYNRMEPPIFMRSEGNKAVEAPYHILRNCELKHSNINMKPVEQYIRDQQFQLALIKNMI
ncbi:MAG: hypothetical protein ACLFTH_04045 [Candidatus Woesearchaeota archaeon]